MKPSILIVDDEKDTRDFMARALEDRYHVTTAPDAEQAMKALEADPSIVLMLSDVRMPGADGLQLLKAAKAKYPKLICILLTAFGTIEQAVSATKDGAEDFLMKPIDLDQLDSRVEKALKTGASKLIIADLTDEMVEDVIWPALKMGASYEQYLLGTAFARPVIGKKLAEIALAEGADAIAHGATGKGNDQVRFELAIKAFAPDMTIIAPWREWNIKSREEEIEYCRQHGIELPFDASHSYSRDRNLWHISHEGLELEDPACEPNYDHLLKLGVSPEKAPDEPTIITLTFKDGVPTHLDGVAMEPSPLLEKLNELGGANGIGISDIVENRVVGMKSRGVYETPGGTILYAAHEELEHLTLDRETYRYKQEIALEYADLIYNGKWYSKACSAITAFIDETQENVTGSVKLKLYKGNIKLAGIFTDHALYDESISSFGDSELYDHKDAEGFINLFTLPLKINAM